MSINLKISNKKGFTLIELLVVMAIIAVLSAISIFALQGARAQGRDSKRKADLETIRSALELYKADCSAYPASLPSAGTALTGNCTGSTNTYIRAIPNDPSAATASYRYFSPAGNRTYTLCTYLEDSTTTAPAPCAGCAGGTCRYYVTNP